MSDWSHEETDDPIHADRRNFYKAEKWSKDVQRVVELLFAGSLEGAGNMPLNQTEFIPYWHAVVTHALADDVQWDLEIGERHATGWRGHRCP